MIDRLDKEFVKAALRREHGSVQAFEEKEGLPRNSVSDLLRGKMSQRVRDAVDAELTRLIPPSDLTDNGGVFPARHRLSAGAA